MDDISTKETDSYLAAEPPGGLGHAANEDTPQTTQMEQGGNVANLTSTKLPLPHQVGETKGVDVIYEHRTHHNPLEGVIVNHEHRSPLNNRSSTTTPLTNRGETNHPPDATTTHSKTEDPHSFLGEVSNEEDTTPDAGEHTPSNEPDRHDTVMSDIGTLQTHRNKTLGRPDPNPPDKS